MKSKKMRRRRNFHSNNSKVAREGIQISKKQKERL
jgi:hypothetical protein